MRGASHEDDEVLATLYAPFAEQRERLASWGLPGSGVRMLMSSCEGRCFFCAQPEVLNMPPHMVTRPEEALAWVAEASPSVGDRLLIGGTEPATHPVLLDVVREARGRGFARVEVMTSGLRLAQPGVAERWAEAGVSEVCVPLYATEAALHDAVVGIPGHHARLLAGLERARAAGVDVAVHTLALRRTLHDLARLADLVRARFGTPLCVAPLREKEQLFRYAEEAPSYRAVESVVRAADVRLTGFPDCVAPEVPRGAPGIIAVYFRGQRTVQAAPCVLCARASGCPGAVPAHLAVHGVDDLVPITPGAPDAPGRTAPR